MEAVQKKGFWILVIAVILVVIAVRIVWPAQKSEDTSNLVVVIDTDAPIGSIGVSYTGLDGSEISEHVINADESLLIRGDRLFFQNVRWPATVTVWGDLSGTELLMSFPVEQAPDAQCRWEAVIYDGDDGLAVALNSVSKE